MPVGAKSPEINQIMNHRPSAFLMMARGASGLSLWFYFTWEKRVSG